MWYTTNTLMPRAVEARRETSGEQLGLKTRPESRQACRLSDVDWQRVASSRRERLPLEKHDRPTYCGAFAERLEPTSMPSVSAAENQGPPHGVGRQRGTTAPNY